MFQAFLALISSLLRGRVSPTSGHTQKPETGSQRPAQSLLGVSLPLFVDWKGQTEGLRDHTASEGQFTYAYGILPATANHYGVKRKDFKTSLDFALTVYGFMLRDMKARYPLVLIDKMDREIAHAVFSYYINLGSFQGTTKVLLEAGKVKEAFLHNLNVVTYSNRQTGIRYFSKGLAKRRALEWNKVAPLLDGKAITHVVLSGTAKRPTCHYQANGEMVYNYVSTYPLSPDNNFKSVTL